jgi:hypothetical protein
MLVGCDAPDRFELAPAALRLPSEEEARDALWKISHPDTEADLLRRLELVGAGTPERTLQCHLHSVSAWSSMVVFEWG